MNVISEDGEPLNSAVSLKTIRGTLDLVDTFGLVMESRGGARGKLGERNTDYLIALETILQRLMDTGVETVRIYIVSNEKNILNMDERSIEIEGKTDIAIKGVDLNELRKKICAAQAEKKANPLSKGGNPTKRILIKAEVSDGAWKAIVEGRRT